MRVPVLPYLEQDQWSCDKKPTDVPAIVIDNEYIRATVTPQVLLFPLQLKFPFPILSVIGL